MAGVRYYRDPSLPFFEAKWCEAYPISYKKHFHDELSIGVIDNGTSKVWCEGKSLRVEAGSVICFPPYMPHACSPESDFKWTYKMLFIHPSWIQTIFHEVMPADIPFLYESHNNQKAAARISQCVKALEGSSVSPMDAEACFIELIHTLTCNNNEDVRHSRAATNPKHLDLIKAYLHEHYKEKIMLDDLVRVTGLSKFHLSHLFKKGSSLPPHAYQNLLRINFAKRELSRRRPIADIALEAGFTDQSHMTKVFMHTVGLTPHKYAASLK